MAHRRQKHLRLVLPTPTPQGIEAALVAMRDGKSVYGRWVRRDNFEADADADGLWWVTVIGPDGVDQGCYGGGTTSSEAAAVAWINACVCAWWAQGPGLSGEDYAKVPRRVPEGWQFELYERPCGRREGETFSVS
jgi:hypothetical protein